MSTRPSSDQVFPQDQFESVKPLATTTRPHRAHTNQEPSYPSDHKSQPQRDRSQSTSTSRPTQREPIRHLDLIDRLDDTSFFSAGSFYRHDGPFDAVAPHRNKRLSRAPVAAFPGNSATSSLRQLRLARANASNSTLPTPTEDTTEPPTKDEVKPKTKLTTRDSVLDEFSLGLGASTFLEGAPAPRVAAAQDRDKNKEDTAEGAARPLSRKKSLVQRFRRAGSTKGTPPVKGSSKEPGPASPTDTDTAKEKTKAEAKAEDDDSTARVSMPDIITYTPEEAPQFISQEVKDEPASPPPPSPSSKGGGLLRRVKSLRRIRPSPPVAVPAIPSHD